MKYFRWLPSFLTLLNLAAGAVAIILSVEGNYYGATLAVMVAIFFDGLDGWTAGMLHATSDFGEKLDSLADIVSFGVAPAIILYGIGLKDLGILGWIVAILFPIAGAVRLALFKAGAVPGYFVGLPTTAAAGTVVALMLGRVDFPAWGWAIVIILLATLMVSRVRYPNIKCLNARGIRLWKILLFIGVVIGAVVAVTLVNPRYLFVLPAIVYILHGIKEWALSKVRIVKVQH
ncbi:CDP-diacylglycerol--serine O-phosphatidyltransferase [Chloroflexota bacterium]